MKNSFTSPAQQQAVEFQLMQAYQLSLEQNRLNHAAVYLHRAEMARARGEIANAILNYRRAITAARGSMDSQMALQALVSLQTDAKSKLAEAEELLASNRKPEAAALLSRIKKDYGNLPASNEIQQSRGRLEKTTRLASVPSLKVDSPPSGSDGDLEPVKSAYRGPIDDALSDPKPDSRREALPAVQKLAGALKQ